MTSYEICFTTGNIFKKVFYKNFKVLMVIKGKEQKKRKRKYNVGKLLILLYDQK